MYRDDVEAARLRIAALEQENVELRRENASLRTPPPAPSAGRRTVALVIAGVVAIVGTVAWASAAARAPRPVYRVPSPAPSPPIASVAPASLASGAPPPVDDPPIEAPSAPATDAPSEPAIDPIALALEPAHPNVIEVLATREHGGELFVVLRAHHALLWEHAQRDAGTLERTLDDYEDRLGICEDGAEDDEASTRCILEEAPNEWIGLRDATCDDVHAIEVAALTRGEDGWVVRARTVIAGPVCPGGAGDREPEIRASDVDRDGHVELTVIAPFEVPSTRMDQYEGGAIGAVLDARDLHPQLVVLREYDASYGDYETGTRTLATTWHLDDADRDGSIEAHLRQRIADVDDVGRSSDAHTADCPYDRATDRWRCAEAWVADPRTAAISGTELAGVDIVGLRARRPR